MEKVNSVPILILYPPFFPRIQVPFGTFYVISGGKDMPWFYNKHAEKNALWKKCDRKKCVEWCCNSARESV